MKISFPTAACPSLDFTAAAGLARRLRFDGVELHATRDSSLPSTSNALLTSTEKIRSVMLDADIAVSSLNVGTADADLPARLDLAAELKCPIVRFRLDDLFSIRLPVRNIAIELVRTQADRAADRGITLLFENPPLKHAIQLVWNLCDLIDHPAVGCCWSTLSTALAGESPAVAVPTLNSRIRAVLLQDRSGQSICDIGSGDLPLNLALDRLRGIGFDRDLIIAPPTAATIPALEQSLTTALRSLWSWKIETKLAPAPQVAPA